MLEVSFFKRDENNMHFFFFTTKALKCYPLHPLSQLFALIVLSSKNWVTADILLFIIKKYKFWCYQRGKTAQMSASEYFPQFL